MERREKTEFIMEQMRLLIVVARQKDAEVEKTDGKESLGGGEAEWVKVRVGGRKVNEAFLKEKDNEVKLAVSYVFDSELISINQDLKLKFYDLMIQHALHSDSYLDAAKYYEKVWQTPSVKEDVNGKGRTVGICDAIP
jgi:26S proteasome regulatory subunit N5